MNMFTWFRFKRKIKEELKLKRKLMRKYLKWKKKNFKNIDDPFVRVKLDGADISDDKIQALEASGNFWEREGFDAAEIKKTCSEKNVFSFILKKKYKNGLSVIKDKWKGTDNTDKSYCLTKLSWYIFLTEKKQYKYLVRQYAIKSWITEHYETVYFKLKKKDDKFSKQRLRLYSFKNKHNEESKLMVFAQGFASIPYAIIIVPLYIIKELLYFIIHIPFYIKWVILSPFKFIRFLFTIFIPTVIPTTFKYLIIFVKKFFYYFTSFFRIMFNGTLYIIKNIPKFTCFLFKIIKLMFRIFFNTVIYILFSPFGNPKIFWLDVTIIIIGCIALHLNKSFGLAVFYSAFLLYYIYCAIQFDKNKGKDYFKGWV